LKREAVLRREGKGKGRGDSRGLTLGGAHGKSWARMASPVWYYVENGQQRGPMDEAQLRALARDGRIRSSTLVWKSGMPQWSAYSSVLQEVKMPDGMTLCAACHQPFQPVDLVTIEGQPVCALCKPTFVQKMLEGAPIAAAPGKLSVEEIMARPFKLNIGKLFKRSTVLFQKDPLMSIVPFLLASVVGVAAYFLLIIVVFLCLPLFFVLPFVVCGLVGPVIGGFYAYYLEKSRDQSPLAEKIFGGFGPRFWELAGSGALACIFSGVIMMAGYIPMIVVAVADPASEPHPAVVIITLLMAYPLMFYSYAVTMFAIPLVIDKGARVFESISLSLRMAHKAIGMMMLLMLLNALLYLIGLCALCVGLYVALPFMFFMMVFAYRDAFDDLAPLR
jgi:hypothetical protein